MTQKISPDKEQKSMIQEMSPDEHGLDAEGSFDAVIPQHPMGIKPAGNQFVAEHNIKAAAGVFSYVPDELLIQLFEFFEPLSLLQIGATCKALYAYSRLEDLWKTQLLKYAFPLQASIAPRTNLSLAIY